ncbi:MAG: arginine--tRNA ligase, partial [Nanoarchaeota archaeon]
ILSDKLNYGKENIGKGEEVLIEHTSINPNASPHVGRIRNALIGDSIVRINKFFGFKPEVHYYVNDVSKQIAILVLANAEKSSFSEMLKKYSETAQKVEADKELEKKVFALLYKFEHKDKETTKKFKAIVSTCVKGQAKILSRLGIEYDSFDYESKYVRNSEKILKLLEKTGKLKKDEDNRHYIDQSGTDIEIKTKAPVFVLTRNDGTGLYPLRDISYTIEKLEKAKRNIIVLGEDQKLYAEQLALAMKILGYDFPKVVHYSFMLISDKGESKKMSTRRGDVVLLEDFLAEVVKKAKEEIAKRKTKGDAEKVGLSAVKYSILSHNSNKNILFNLSQALSFEGNTGPYLLYTYARASSILRKAKGKNPGLVIEKVTPQETALIKKLELFPGIAKSVYNSLDPSLIAHYSFELSQLFNEFYHSCKVIGDPCEAFRLNLVSAFRIVLKSSLSLLGIETIERM